MTRKTKSTAVCYNVAIYRAKELNQVLFRGLDRKEARRLARDFNWVSESTEFRAVVIPKQ
jgi:hypothetical protein